MQLLFIGDPHLKITRFDLSTQFVSWINKKVEEIQPDAVVNLGDTFDTHAVLRSEVKNIVMDHILHCIKNTKQNKYFYILGNHDFYKPNSAKYHALKDWKFLDNLHIIDERTDFSDINATMIPYYPDHNDFPLDTLPICVAHQTFIGADYGYKREDVGVDADDVSAEIIISGHIHLKQEFGKVIYPGTPFSQNMNDINQVKGVMLFDTETYETSFIECPLPKWFSLNYEIASNSDIQAIHDDIVKNINDEDHWIIQITGPKQEIVSYQSSDMYKRLINEKSVQIRPTFTDKSKKKQNIQGLSMEQIIKEYFDNIYDGSLDKKMLTDKSIEILRSVKSK